ncbi:MAG: sulfatase [Flavobacteriaceae bacterium]
MKLKVIIAGILLIFLLGCADSTTISGRQTAVPNIIFIMADDHAYQAISAYGHPLSVLAPTPNIDRIAKNGARFENSFCTNAICGPSRAVILTGKHSHMNGFRMNGEEFDGTQPTLPKYLQKKGYETAVIGKWHLHGKPTGFDYWDIINDQGNYYNPEFIKGEDSTIIEGYVTDIVTDKGLKWLEKKQQQKKPFFLMLHHKAPHRNWMPALRHTNKYDSITFPLPGTYFLDFKDQEAAATQQQTIYEDMYEGHDLKMTREHGSFELAHNPWKTDFDRMTSSQREAWDKAYQAKNEAFHEAKLEGEELAIWKGQRYLQDYLATVAAVDEGVGAILDYLEETGLDQNTLVVYTSDQGFYLGERGWFDKRFMYEESLRMPLLMQFPGVIEPGTRVTALVQNLDFAQTFLDFADGMEFTGQMQGQSFKGLLDGSAHEKDFRGLVYYHYYDYPAFHMVKKQYGIRTKRYKLIHFYDDIDRWEFYDLLKDPQELYNAYEDEAYREVVLQMHHKLDSVQKVYQVTEAEFQKASKERIEKAYKSFARLRGKNNE